MWNTHQTCVHVLYCLQKLNRIFINTIFVCSFSLINYSLLLINHRLNYTSARVLRLLFMTMQKALRILWIFKNFYWNWKIKYFVHTLRWYSFHWEIYIRKRYIDINRGKILRDTALFVNPFFVTFYLDNKLLVCYHPIKLSVDNEKYSCWLIKWSWSKSLSKRITVMDICLRICIFLYQFNCQQCLLINYFL